MRKRPQPRAQPRPPLQTPWQEGSPLFRRWCIAVAACAVALAALAGCFRSPAPAPAAPAPRGLADLPPALVQQVQVPPERIRHLPRARVVRVVDGDTVEVRLGSRTEKVRFIGINTPESVDPRRPVQAYGKEAAAFTRSVLEGREVRLERDVEERDKYGRLLAYVYLEDGTFVNALLVRAGLAQTMTVPPNVRHADLLVQLQRQARAENRGLWALPDYRDGRRTP